MAPSTRQCGVQRISGLPVASAENVRVDIISSSIGSTHDSISPTERPASKPSPFSIHYTNIRGLRSNFSSVEHHLATALPNILLLSETQLSSTVSPDPFQISHYNFLHRFRSNGGVCAYYNINTPIARLMDLESSDFDVMWLKICLPTSTTFLCFSYCSLALTDYAVFFDYLTSCHESVLSSHPSAEVIYLGDFNVHHTEWLGSSCTDVGGVQAHSFSILNDLEQIIQHPTRFQIVMTKHQILLIYSSHPILLTISIPFLLHLGLLTIHLSLSLLLWHLPLLFPPLNADFGTLRMLSGLTRVNSFETFPGMTTGFPPGILIR